MKLTTADLTDTRPWAEAAIALPSFNREKAAEAAKRAPEWVHFGAGNIFRAFPAALLQRLLDEGYARTGLIVAEGFDYEIVDRIFKPHDNLSLLVTLKADGGIDARVVASIVEALVADGGAPDFERLRAVFRAPSLRMASFTITEKGYDLNAPGSELAPDVRADIASGPARPVSYIGKVASLLHERFLAGKAPIAMVSMDNCSRNGNRLHEAVSTFAARWSENGLVEKGFLDYVNTPSLVAFPWTMIDKITPRPDATVQKMLRDRGFESTECLVTAKNSYIAPFVNAEEVQYMVVEEAFPNGRPPLEKAGVIFTTRETVEKVEKMKVSTCLNPLHTALAIFGCLLGYERISEEMRDPDLKKLVERIGYKEGLPVVVDPEIISPRVFLHEVLQVRFPNPFMPDTPQRIATDTSQKLAVRFGETIKAYAENSRMDTHGLRGIPLVLAGWCRYLLGVDDTGQPFQISPEPLHDELSKHLNGLALGQAGPFAAHLRPILSNTRIFGVNLYTAGIGETVEHLFVDLMAGPGAVRSTLRREVDTE